DDYRDGTDRIFIGMQDSLRWGLWGGGSGGAGWQFNFNAKTGFIGMGGINSGGSRLEINEVNGYDAAFYKNGFYRGAISTTDTTLQIYPVYGSSFCIPNPCPSQDLILIPP